MPFLVQPSQSPITGKPDNGPGEARTTVARLLNILVWLGDARRVGPLPNPRESGTKTCAGRVNSTATRRTLPFCGTFSLDLTSYGYNRHLGLGPISGVSQKCHGYKTPALEVSDAGHAAGHLSGRLDDSGTRLFVQLIGE